jgi:hypothetical protein
MAINLICPKCSSNLSAKSKICKSCDYEFKSRKKYGVVVKDQNGKRVSRVLDSICSTGNRRFRGIPVAICCENVVTTFCYFVSL